MNNDNPLELDRLEQRLKDTIGVHNAGQAERDRDLVKTGALLSIARSLEANAVPSHWESLEGPSGAILGWFDPTVARAIAQALGATEARQADAADDEQRPVIVGSVVALTAALEQALEQGDPSLATLGEVLDLGRTEGTLYAVVRWDDDDESVAPGKVWVSELTALEQREGEPVDEAELERLNREADGEPDLPTPTAEAVVDNLDLEGDAELDDDFDTVVEPAAPVDGLSALKGKSKGKSKRAPMFGGSDDDGM